MLNENCKLNLGQIFIEPFARGVAKPADEAAPVTLREMPGNFHMLHKRRNCAGQRAAEIGDEIGKKIK